MNTRNRLLSFLFVFILLTLVMPISAQDTEIPPTVENFLTATVLAQPTEVPTVVPTEVPTVEPTVTPVPVPPPPTPLETAFSQINWTVLILGVALGFFVLIGFGFQKLAVLVPLAVWEAGKGAARANYGVVDRVVDGTIDPTDNFLWKELHDKLEEQFTLGDQLRADMNNLKATVDNNKIQAAQHLSATATALSEQISASAAPPQ